MNCFRFLLALAGLVLAAPAVSAFEPERLAMRGEISLPQGHTEPAILTVEEEAPADPLSPAAGAACPALPAGGEARLTGLARSPLLTFDLLLLIQRQNE